MRIASENLRIDVVYEVTTVEEVALHWGKHPVTIRRAIDTGRQPLVGRKSGKMWLISTASVYRRWGLPVVPFEAW